MATLRNSCCSLNTTEASTSPRLPLYPLEARSPAELIAEIVFACVLCIFGVTGNLMVSFVIHSRRFTHSSMYYFMLHLAYADLLVCFVSMPLTVLSTQPRPVLILGPIACKLVRFIQYLLPPASVAILTATAIDRYLHICLPFKSITTTNATRQIAAGCWLFAITLTLPIFYLIKTRYVEYKGEAFEYCSIDETNSDRVAGTVYLVTRGMLGFATPLAVVCFLYYRILATVWRSKAANKNSRNRQRASVIKSLLTVVIAFCLSWAPFSATNKAKLFTDKRDRISRAEIITFWIGLSASVYNPLIYAFYNNNFRSAFIGLIRRRMTQRTEKQVPPPRPRAKTMPEIHVASLRLADNPFRRRAVTYPSPDGTGLAGLTGLAGKTETRLEVIEEESVLEIPSLAHKQIRRRSLPCLRPKSSSTWERKKLAESLSMSPGRAKTTKTDLHIDITLECHVHEKYDSPDSPCASRFDAKRQKGKLVLQAHYNQSSDDGT